MANSETTSNAPELKKVPVWKNAPFWHITFLMAVFSVFYYMDVIIDYFSLVNLKREIFYTVHDLHRALFLIPVMYATYEFRLKGIIVTSFLSLLVFLPRALIVSPYPDPLLRALIFTISMIIMGVFLSSLLNSITRRKELEQDLSLAQDALLREQAEEALRESEDKYKSLIDNIPEIIFTIDLEGKITFVSKRTKEILGYESEETINRNIFSFIPEEDHQRAIENLQKGMTGEKVKHFQIPMIAKSGERLIFECSFTRVYKDGKVVGAQGTAADITELKQAEETLRASEERFRLLSEATFEAIAIHEKGVLLNANDQYFKMFGYEPYEALGKEMISVTIAPESLEFVKKQVAKDSLEQYESIGIRKDGTRFPIIVRTRKMKYKGHIVRCGVIRDITERKREVEALQLKNLVFDVSIAANSIADIDGVITEANEAFLQIWGYPSKDEVVGNPISYFLNDQEEAVAIVNALKGKGNWQGNFTAKKKDGSTFIANTMATAVRDENGKVTGYQSSVMDITENKRFESEVLASEARLNTLVDSTPFPVAIVDVEDNKIEYWSRSALELFGHTAPTATEWYQLAYPDPEYRRDVIERWKPFLVKARLCDTPVNTGEYRISCHDGSARICELFATFLSDRFIVTFNDITERKRAESQREDAFEKIIDLNETLEQRIKERTAELNKYIDLLEETNRAFVGRELRMIELKERIAELERKEK